MYSKLQFMGLLMTTFAFSSSRFFFSLCSTDIRTVYVHLIIRPRTKLYIYFLCYSKAFIFCILHNKRGPKRTVHFYFYLYCFQVFLLQGCFLQWQSWYPGIQWSGKLWFSSPSRQRYGILLYTVQFMYCYCTVCKANCLPTNMYCTVYALLQRNVL